MTEIRVEGYAGKKSFEAIKKGNIPIRVFAPDKYAALAEAAKYWGERWQDIDFYCECEIVKRS